MTDVDLARRLSMAVGAEIAVERVSPEITRVETPFVFADGDHLVIRLCELNGEHYEWTDLAHTYMHLSYWIDIDTLCSGKRAEILEGVLRRHDVEDRDGELVLAASADDLGSKLLHFSQALVQVADLEYLTQERVRSTFVEDPRAMLADTFGDRAQFDYVDPEQDLKRLYPITCLLDDAPRPFAVLAIPGDDACRDATIVLQQFHAWERPLFSTGVFEDQETINRKVLARFTDVVDKAFSSLAGNESEIVRYVERAMRGRRPPPRQATCATSFVVSWRRPRTSQSFRAHSPHMRASRRTRRRDLRWSRPGRKEPGKPTPLRGGAATTLLRRE